MSEKNGKNILVLDDEPDVRHLLEVLLVRRGYRVFCTEDGLEALDMIRENRIDVALVDLLMPAMGGEDFLREMNSLPRDVRPVPVVVSGKRLAGLHGELEALEVFEVVGKPFEFEEIEGVVFRALEASNRSMDGRKGEVRG
jgi:CheY-like chemotaxis protein